MHRRSFALALPVLLIALLVLAPLPAAVSAKSATETFMLELESPNIAQAPNGDRVEITGHGHFSVHPKSAGGSGAFTHKDKAGNVLGSGTWTATKLLSYQSYGCGIVHFPDGTTVVLPDNFCGGKVMMRVRLTAGSQQAWGILTVFCIIGEKVPASVDEGVRLNVPGIINFNKVVTGENVYIRM